MKISRKTDYALRVLVGLIDSWDNDPVSISNLAQQNTIPKRFLEHILLTLKSCKWVESVQGKYGGYRLAMSPERITIGAVVRKFSGVLAPIGCVSVAAHENCKLEGACQLKKFFKEVRDFTALLMDQATIADVVSGKPLVPIVMLHNTKGSKRKG